MTANPCEASLHGCSNALEKKILHQVRICTELWKTAPDREAPAVAHVPLGPSESGFEGPFTSPRIETRKKKRKRKLRTVQLKNGRRTGIDIFPKKTCSWVPGTWNDAQPPWSPGKCRPQPRPFARRPLWLLLGSVEELSRCDRLCLLA